MSDVSDIPEHLHDTQAIVKDERHYWPNIHVLSNGLSKCVSNYCTTYFFHYILVHTLRNQATTKKIYKKHTIYILQTLFQVTPQNNTLFRSITVGQLAKIDNRMQKKTFKTNAKNQMQVCIGSIKIYMRQFCRACIFSYRKIISFQPTKVFGHSTHKSRLMATWAKKQKKKICETAREKQFPLPL